MKPLPKPAKRDLFTELSQGIADLQAARQGKATLRTHVVNGKPAPDVTPERLMQMRKRLNISRAILAGYLRTNVRTLESWEQGRAKPNVQAALLITLVQQYPDTIQRLQAL